MPILQLAADKVPWPCAAGNTCPLLFDDPTDPQHRPKSSERGQQRPRAARGPQPNVPEDPHGLRPRTALPRKCLRLAPRNLKTVAHPSPAWPATRQALLSELTGEACWHQANDVMIRLGR